MCEYIPHIDDFNEFEWCASAGTYMNIEHCKIVGCEKCSYYLDS